MRETTQAPKTTPGWVVAAAAAALGLVLAMMWASLPWRDALVASAAVFVAVELGKAGARWHDDKR